MRKATIAAHADRTSKRSRATVALNGKFPAAIPPLPVRRFTVEEYHRLVEIGVLQCGEPYELLNGWIVSKMGINPPHAYAVDALAAEFYRLCGLRAAVRSQQPITLGESEPEPDFVLATGLKTDYAARHPGPADIHVLAEVADSSLDTDRTTKLEIYAKSKIPVYWIVNLIDRRVEVYTEPRGGKKPTYRTHVDYAMEGQAPVVIGGKTIGHVPVAGIIRY